MHIPLKIRHCRIFWLLFDRYCSPVLYRHGLDTYQAGGRFALRNFYRNKPQPGRFLHRSEEADKQVAGAQAAKYCNYSAYGIIRVCQEENKRAASPQPTLKSMPLKTAVIKE